MSHSTANGSNQSTLLMILVFFSRELPNMQVCSTTSKALGNKGAKAGYCHSRLD